MSRFDPDGLKDAATLTPEKRLWCAVLFRIFQDACRKLPESADNAVKIECDQARSWLLSGQDMRIVCELAGFDPDAVRESARRMDRAGWPVIKLDASEKVEAAPLAA